MASDENHSLKNYKFEKNNNDQVLSDKINQEGVDLDCMVDRAVQNITKDEKDTESFLNTAPKKDTADEIISDLAHTDNEKDSSSTSITGNGHKVNIDYNLALKNDKCKEFEDKSCQNETAVPIYQTLPETLGDEEKKNYEPNPNSFLDDSNVSFIFSSNHISNNTPCKDMKKNNLFKKGVTCTSTPLHQDRIKTGIRNLSMIKEDDEGSIESKETHMIPTLNEASSVLLNNNTNDNCRQDALNAHKNSQVLRKDELSLLIDLPNDTLLKEAGADLEKHNLTLPVKNCGAVVYKDIAEKTLDDILINDGELASVKVPNILETGSDKEEIIKKAIVLKEFISTNAEENNDNNNPEWELLKKLETDDERYKAVRMLWRNLAIPNLKQNLSVFNWRKKNSLPAIKNIAPIIINRGSKRMRNFTYDCTEVFDVGKKNLLSLYNRHLRGLNLDCDNDTTIMASLNKKPRLENKYNPIPARNEQADLELRWSVQERLRRHDEAQHEIKAVHEFYNGLKNQGNGGYGNVMVISHSERQRILDVENIINHYPSSYTE